MRNFLSFPILFKCNAWISDNYSIHPYNILLNSVMPAVDATVREYVIDAAGLHELARIPFDGKPDNILCDDDRRALIVEDYREHYSKSTVWLCRRAQTGTLSAAGWSRTEIALPHDRNINIGFWARVDKSHIAIRSGNTLYICEFIWFSTARSLLAFLLTSRCIFLLIASSAIIHINSSLHSNLLCILPAYMQTRNLDMVVFRFHFQFFREFLL